MGFGNISPLSASTVLSNLANSFGDYVQLNNGPLTVQGAQAFTTGSGTWTLNSVTIQLQAFASGTDDLILTLNADDNGGIPDTLLAALDLTPSGTISTSPTDYTYDPAVTVTLDGDTTYWLVASTTSTIYNWRGTTSNSYTGDPGWSLATEHYVKVNSNPWTPSGASSSLFVSIDATAAPVPEPSAWALMVGGLFGIALWRRKRH